MQRFFRRRNIQHHEAVPAATTDKAGRGVPLTPLAEERAKVEPRKRGPRLRGPFALALALVLPVCATTALAQPAAATPDGPISIVYRDDVSNERTLNGVAHYGAVLGRDRSVTFIVNNQSAVPVCDGTFTREGPNNGKFSLSCLRGLRGSFSGDGTYEKKKGDSNDRFTAQGQTSLGSPIKLIVGRPAERR
jgi:hypothetical protein